MGSAPLWNIWWNIFLLPWNLLLHFGPGLSLNYTAVHSVGKASNQSLLYVYTLASCYIAMFAIKTKQYGSFLNKLNGSGIWLLVLNKITGNRRSVKAIKQSCGKVLKCLCLEYIITAICCQHNPGVEYFFVPLFSKNSTKKCLTKDKKCF